jgi:hypothetical protein
VPLDSFSSRSSLDIPSQDLIRILTVPVLETMAFPANEQDNEVLAREAGEGFFFG